MANVGGGSRSTTKSASAAAYLGIPPQAGFPAGDPAIEKTELEADDDEGAVSNAAVSSVCINFFTTSSYLLSGHIDPTGFDHMYQSYSSNL